MLKTGDRAPSFVLRAGNGTQVRLSDLKGRKVVLYFYPKDDTSGCTKEACDFEANRGELTKRGAVVLGVSADSESSHAAFATKYGLSFPLLSDPERTVIKAYGVWKKKSMYGRTYMGIERTTFIIDEKGIVRKVFPKVRVPGHTSEVLEAL